VALNWDSHWRAHKWLLVFGALSIVQYLSVLPVFAAYTDQILKGKTSSVPSLLHWLYILIELSKLGLLLTLGLRADSYEISYAMPHGETL